MRTLARPSGLLLCGCIVLASSFAFASGIAVTTYHYDSLRTGWNKQETVLSASAFPSTFGVLSTVAVDDQVDAQPLLVPSETIAGAVHDVLYVVTENNTVYALDAKSGQVLLTRNLGAPVPTPLGCANNGPNVGITSTPVIDLTRNRIYVMAYVNGTPPQYQLHSLNLITLADAFPPVTVAASHKLTDGSTFAFNATYQRQRPALLELNGTVYAGFGSFCDFQASFSRGWVIGWAGHGLIPLSGHELNDTQATSPTSFFLSSVWMSGFGLSSNGSTIFFSTGNSDCNFYLSPELCPSQSTYDGVTNIQESVVSLMPSLTTRTGVFTPSNVFQMDNNDADLGAAGVLLLPTLSGVNLAAIVSKDGRLFLLDQSNLGTALDTHQLASGCWCGATYYRGSDGIGRVVTGAGSLQTWQVSTTPAPHLVAESTTAMPKDDQDPGFFTVVSSNQRQAGTPIIWAVGRPTGTPANLTLYAFSATPAANGTLTQLYSAPAGSWPNTSANANVVPLVANGRVYVAAYKTVTIFGRNGTTPTATPAVAVSEALPASEGRVTGMLIAIDGTNLTLLTRTGQTVQVNAAAAAANERVPIFVVGQPYTVIATAHTSGAPWDATAITRAKPGQGAWPPDEQ
jgi:outer membrane protein assembly factor BamB